MDLQEFTGKSMPNSNPKTAKETEDYVQNLIKTKNYKSIWDFVDDLAVLLARIGEESLDSSKIVGEVGYAGSPLKPRWAIKDGCEPFHIKDSITGKFVSDPRVLLIGRIICKIGSQQGYGYEFMEELYKATGKEFHSFISPLGYAWSGISEWSS
jgi:hypothetical protein